MFLLFVLFVIYIYIYSFFFLLFFQFSDFSFIHFYFLYSVLTFFTLRLVRTFLFFSLCSNGIPSGALSNKHTAPRIRVHALAWIRAPESACTRLRTRVIRSFFFDSIIYCILLGSHWIVCWGAEFFLADSYAAESIVCAAAQQTGKERSLAACDRSLTQILFFCVSGQTP